MAKTQKNKATSYHIGQLKAKLAKLKRELLIPSSGGGGGGGGKLTFFFYSCSLNIISIIADLK